MLSRSGFAAGDFGAARWAGTDLPPAVRRRALLAAVGTVSRRCDAATVYFTHNVSTGTAAADEGIRAALAEQGVSLEHVSLTHAPETKENLWEKEYNVWIDVWRRRVDDYDWFIKLEADSLLVVPNFRRMLRTVPSLRPSRHLFLGPVTWHRPPTGAVMSHYLLSAGALREVGPSLVALRTAERGGRGNERPDWHDCEDKLSMSGDFELSRCLASVNIPPARESFDREGREYFVSCNLQQRITLPHTKSFFFFNGRDPSMVKYGCCNSHVVMSHNHKDICKLVAAAEAVERQAQADPEGLTTRFLAEAELLQPPPWCVGRRMSDAERAAARRPP